MALILRSDEVVDLLTLEEAIEVLEAMAIEESRGSSSAHTPIRIHIPRGTMRVVSGALTDSDLVGTRVTVPGTDGLITVFELSTGTPLAVISSRISSMRSAASIGVAIKHLSLADLHTLAMIGTGNNALGFIEAALAVREIENIRVFSRSEERRKSFVDKAAEALGREVIASSSSEAAIDGAEVVILGTNSLVGAIDPDHLHGSSLVCSFGYPTEIPDELYKSAIALFSSSQRQENMLALYKTYIDEEMRHPFVDTTDPDMPTLGDFIDVGLAITGEWQRPEEGCVVFRESQGGVGDVALGNFVYQKAKKLGRGVEIDLSISAR